MENSERHLFEQQWQQAFLGAEAAAPSEEIWLSINGALSRTENTRNKKRVVYYQRLAAAMLIISVSSLLVVYWQWNRSLPPSSLSQVPTPSQTNDLKNSPTNTGLLPQPNVTNLVTENRGAKGNRVLIASMDILQSQGLIVPGEKKEVLFTASMDSLKGTGKNDSVHLGDYSILVKSVPMTVAEELALAGKLKSQLEETIIEPEKSNHPLWASVGFAGGSYSPDVSSPALGSFAALSKGASAGSSGGGTGGVSGSSTASPSASRRSSIGTSYSFGMMVGKQVAQRWLVQTGLTYWKQQQSYESNIVGISGQTTTTAADFAIANGSSYLITTPYTLNSTSEFISVPVQVGYILKDKKLGWILNAGVAPDFFLHNTLEDKAGTYTSLTQTSGGASAFRTVSWSGLASTEISIRINDHYRFALVPGIRYSFTNIVKDAAGSSKPLVVDIGFRFRYIFK